MDEIVSPKSSSSDELKRYFLAILKLSESGNEFPVNLDEIWPLVYSEKGKAVRALKNDFMQDVDYMTLAQNGKQDSSSTWGGNNKVTYMLTVSCMEFFIARKVRPVFEVYRQVFHKVAATPSYQIEDPIKRAERWIEEQKQLKAVEAQVKKLAPKADFADQAFRLDSRINIGTCGKVLGLPFGRTTLFRKLRERGVFFSNRNEPKQKYIDAGYFVMGEHCVHKGGADFIVNVTYATQKGLAYIGYLFGRKPNGADAKLLFDKAREMDARTDPTASVQTVTDLEDETLSKNKYLWYTYQRGNLEPVIHRGASLLLERIPSVEDINGIDGIMCVLCLKRGTVGFDVVAGRALNNVGADGEVRMVTNNEDRTVNTIPTKIVGRAYRIVNAVDKLPV